MVAKKAAGSRDLVGSPALNPPRARLATHERRRRWWAVGLATSAVALYAAAFFAPWWHITLYAPQYPKGLSLAIGLAGFGGDVHEIDLLNHYIGMGHLADAAPLERRLAGYGVALVALTCFAIMLAAGKRLGTLALVPAALLPVGFLADAYGWMHHFGNNLDPRAPIRMPPFTPELFGSGVIGQFRTLALPHLGFFLALLGLATLVAAAVVRRRVCGTCPAAGDCRLTCPHLLVLKPRA